MEMRGGEEDEEAKEGLDWRKKRNGEQENRMGNGKA